MLEKYDGVRAFWNPQTKTFYNRKGTKRAMPQEIIDSMPNIFLDGELWYIPPPTTHHPQLTPTHTQRFGRDNFQEALKLVNKIDLSTIDWKSFRFMVFDRPNHPGSFKERYNSIGIKTIYIIYI